VHVTTYGISVTGNHGNDPFVLIKSFLFRGLSLNGKYYLYFTRRVSLVEFEILTILENTSYLS